MQPHRYILTLSCPDTIGIVAAVSSLIASQGGSIIEAHQHAESASQQFFMRIEIRADSLFCSLQTFVDTFTTLAKQWHMKWHLSNTVHKKRVAILCSKQEHCLYDLLARWHSQDFEFDIPCVISNHTALQPLVEAHHIPFHHIPVSPDNKALAYQEMTMLFEHYQIDVIVLARYMQVLDHSLCQKYQGRIINIHHSFLPSFVGAKPYHQAFERGVKLIGATCHYVTEALDAGPIIEQDVVRIDHGDTIADLVRHGKDIEKIALARGLRYHIEDRVLVDGNKTIVFR